MAKAKDIIIEQGKTFRLIVRWEDERIVYKQITAISQTAPAVVTAPGHGAPDGWSVAVSAVKGMTQINSTNAPPKDRDYVQATVLTGDTLELNTVNAALYSPYSSGGYVQYFEPHDLINVTARMKIKNRAGGTTLLSSVGVDAKISVTVDNNVKTITVVINADDTEALTWARGVYDLEADDDGTVYALLTGNVTVSKEVTTTT